MLGRMAGYEKREVTWDELLAHGETYKLGMDLEPIRLGRFLLNTGRVPLVMRERPLGAGLAFETWDPPRKGWSSSQNVYVGQSLALATLESPPASPP